MINVIFYGDSNTWGFDPETGNRYPYEKRWTTICAKKLGENFNCIPSGINGRMTIFDDPQKACRNGVSGLDYALQTNKPLDLFVLMLGTNDLKHTDAEGCAAGMEELVSKVLSANERYSLSSPVFPNGARMLLISPILQFQNINETGRFDSRAESCKFSELYRAIAEKYGLEFLDAATVTDPSSVDGVHLSTEGHEKIGMAMAEKIAAMFEQIV